MRRFARILAAWLLFEALAALQVKRGTSPLLVDWVGRAWSPVADAASSLVEKTVSFARAVSRAGKVAAETRALRQEMENLSLRAARLEAKLAFFEGLVPLAALSKELPGRWVAARCLFRDSAHGVVQLLAGRRDGVRAEAPVISADGVVGRVTTAGNSLCWVELITSPSAAVAVRGSEGRAEGLAVGSRKGYMKVLYVPRRAHIRVGELLVSSGTDGLYPPGLPVAVVSAVREGGGEFLEVTASPSVDMSCLSWVLVSVGWPSPGLEGR